MDMQTKKLDLLKRIVHTETDILGDVRNVRENFGFYDFQEKLGLEKAEYEQLLKDMRHEKLIEIDLHGLQELKNAIIYATDKGAEFLLNASK